MYTTTTQVATQVAQTANATNAVVANLRKRIAAFKAQNNVHK